MTMPDDPFEGDDWKQYADRVLNELVPMIKDSSMSISMVPKGDTDVKFAVELGFCIMMDKPIIVVVEPGSKVPGKLVAVADAIVELHPNNMDDLMSRLEPVINKILGREEGGDS